MMLPAPRFFADYFRHDITPRLMLTAAAGAIAFSRFRA